MGALTTYFDSSALAKLVLAEPGHEQAIELWEKGETDTSWITLPETRSALEAARRRRRIGHRRLAFTIAELERSWDAVVAVRVDETVARSAAALTRRYPLAGGDAIQLASALRVDEEELVFVAWDRSLRAAALSEGLAVAPA